ncbi:MAG: hypothetical protein NVS3B21_36040 [Acidimicrobiales bacterium]
MVAEDCVIISNRAHDSDSNADVRMTDKCCSELRERAILQLIVIVKEVDEIAEYLREAMIANAGRNAATRPHAAFVTDPIVVKGGDIRLGRVIATILEH